MGPTSINNNDNKGTWGAGVVLVSGGVPCVRGERRGKGSRPGMATGTAELGIGGVLARPATWPASRAARGQIIGHCLIRDKVATPNLLSYQAPLPDELAHP